ncbi:hypothetical protein DRN63_05140 [Nanoarchaeota archaeon]|nr:MAG: hypothetical protein DRN63_05140 [Nanoarchaeota archaeon]
MNPLIYLIYFSPLFGILLFKIGKYLVKAFKIKNPWLAGVVHTTPLALFVCMVVLIDVFGTAFVADLMFTASIIGAVIFWFIILILVLLSKSRGINNE